MSDVGNKAQYRGRKLRDQSNLVPGINVEVVESFRGKITEVEGPSVYIPDAGRWFNTSRPGVEVYNLLPSEHPKPGQTVIAGFRDGCVLVALVREDGTIGAGSATATWDELTLAAEWVAVRDS